jgi:hypothetical protein
MPDLRRIAGKHDSLTKPIPSANLGRLIWRARLLRTSLQDGPWLSSRPSAVRQDRPHGGVYGHDPGGGIEIIPLPLPLTYKKLSTSRRLWVNHRLRSCHALRTRRQGLSSVGRMHGAVSALLRARIPPYRTHQRGYVRGLSPADSPHGSSADSPRGSGAESQ